MLEVFLQEVAEAVMGMEVLHRPHTAAVSGPEVFFIEELNIPAVAVVGLERLEMLGKTEAASPDVDTTILFQQGIAGRQYSMLKMAVHYGIEYAVEHHHILQTVGAHVKLELVNHLHHGSYIESAFLLEMRLIGQHLIPLFCQHIGIGATT